MKIVMVNKFLTRHAGAEKYFFDVSELLRSQGHEVVMWGMEPNSVVSSQYPVDSKEKIQKTYNLKPKTYNLSHIDFENPKTFLDRLRCFFRMMYSFEAKKNFKKLVEEFKPDIVHIHNIYHQLSPSFLDVCSSKKIPIVMSVHDYSLICPNYKLFSHGHIDEGCKKNYFHDAFNRSIKNSFLGSVTCAFELWFHHKVLRIYEKSISAYLCPSEFVKNKLIEFGFPKEKVLLLRYFLETPQSAMDSSDSFHQITRYILAYGRLSEEKGFELLIHAMKNLKEDVTLKIAGSGPDEERLKKITKELQLENRVEFLGWKTGDEFCELRKNAACIVVPSIWHDPSPFSVLESLCFGKLVIGFRVGGITEMLEKVDPNLLIEKIDVYALHNKISEVLNYPQKYVSNLAIRAKNLIKEYTNPQVHYAQLMIQYKSVINTKKIDKK